MTDLKAVDAALHRERTVRGWPTMAAATVAVLTPPSTVTAIRNGYAPAVHGSAV